jgi:phenylalanyl-tRNA synthetase beta chain
MKFSYNLIKKLAPGKYTKEQLVEKLNLYSFEAVDAEGDALEISIPPNRYSDAASHLGVAKEAAAILNIKLNDPTKKNPVFDSAKPGAFWVNIGDKNLGRRYMAAYVADARIGSSPDWLKEALETCGLRPINNVVDIMNYTMLELGQPLHAFDADKVSGGLFMRRAKNREMIETIDGQKFALDNTMLVIADDKNPLAIAGIKGGKISEINFRTKRILIESANFDGANIYKTSRKLGLQTDASIRFAHDLSPELAEIGMRRALVLLKELTGAKIYKPTDIYPKKQPKRVLPFNPEKINQLVGFDLKEKEIIDLFGKLGFAKKGKFIDASLLRTDISGLEDLAEEAARLKGYDNLKPAAPTMTLTIVSEEEMILLKDRMRNLLIGAGISEEYNYSFIDREEIKLAPAIVFGNQKAVELANPISRQFEFLRNSLATGLIKNMKENLRFFSEVRIFEIGKIFGREKNNIKETAVLGVLLSSKNAVLELKGLVDLMMQRLGITDYFMPDLNIENKIVKPDESLRIEIDHQVLGYLGSLKEAPGAILEIDLDKLLKAVDEEREYRPFSKYPSIMRDISILVSGDIRINDILIAIQGINPKLIQDVDLIDWYQDERFGEDKKSLTFRIVFQADDRTLTDAEADREIAIINQVITEKFNAELR